MNIEGKKMIDKYGVKLEVGMRVAAATLSYKTAKLRIGHIQKLHDSGRVTLMNDDGSISVLHSADQLIVISDTIGKK